MKHIVLIILGVFMTQTSFAQDCYQTFLNEGIKAYDVLDFEKAINQFKAAEICDDLPANNEIGGWIEKAQNGYINTIKKERTKAQSLALTAKSIIELKKNDDATKAFSYAKYAWKKEDTPESRLALYDVFYQLDSKENRKHFYIRDVEVFNDLSNSIRTIGFIDGGKTIYVSGDMDAELLLYDFDGNKIADLSSEVHWYTDQAYSNTTNTLLVTEKVNKDHFVKGYHLKNSKLSQQALFQYKSTGGDITAIGISKDGEKIAACFDNGEVHILNKEGKLLYQLPKETKGAIYLSFSDNHHLALSHSSLVKVYKLEEDKPNLIFEKEEKGMYSAMVALSSAANYLMTAYSRKVNIWDVKGDSIYSESDKMGYQLDIGMFSSDETYATFGDQFLNLKEKRVVNTLPVEVRNMKFTADKKYLVSNNGSTVARVWEDQAYRVRDRAVDNGTLAGHKDFIVQLSLSPDTTHIITGSEDRTFKIWNPRINASSSVRNPGKYIFNSEVDGRTVIGAIDKGELSLFYENGVFKEYHELPVQQIMAISPDGKYIFANVENGFEVWTLDLNTQHVDFSNGISGVDSTYLAQFSSDDRVAYYTSGSSYSLQVWDMKKGKTAYLSGYDTDLIAIKWSLDNKHIIALDNYGKVYLWNVEQKPMLKKSWTPHLGNGCYNINFSKDGQKIITCGHDNIATVWDLNGGRITRLLGHIRTVYDADFSNDGRFIITASRDKTVKIWTIGGELITTLADFEHPIQHVSFSENGKYIIASYGLDDIRYNDDFIKVWPFDPEVIIEYMEGFGLPDLPESDKLKYGID